jgi:hypothetical protein
MPPLDIGTLRDLLNKDKPSGGTISSCVDEFDYDEERNVLTVSHPGEDGTGGAGTWEYHNVPLSVYVEFAQASSLGTYFNLYIKGRYSYSKVG